MKKYVYSLSLLLLCSTKAKAQSYDTTQIQGFLQHLMQPLDKSQIPTGFLEEYGLPAVGMTPFDGTSNPANWSEPVSSITQYYSPSICLSRIDYING